MNPEVWDALVATAPSTFPEQVDRLLSNLAYLSSEAGVSTSFSYDRDTALGFASAKDSFHYRLQTLQSKGLIEFTGDRSSRPEERGFRLTYDGWRRVQDMEKTGSRSDQAFIAFTRKPEGEIDAAMGPILRQGIEEGIRRAGFRPIFMEDLKHGDRIDDRILVEIRRSRFLVVDTTGRNSNVTFEAGYALGLGRPILWTCRDGDHDSQAFDIRQYSRILWKHGQEAELAEALGDAIEQVVGRGPHAQIPANA